MSTSASWRLFPPPWPGASATSRPGTGRRPPARLLAGAARKDGHGLAGFASSSSALWSVTARVLAHDGGDLVHFAACPARGRALVAGAPVWLLRGRSASSRWPCPPVGPDPCYCYPLPQLPRRLASSSGHLLLTRTQLLGQRHSDLLYPPCVRIERPEPKRNEVRMGNVWPVRGQERG
jgi:hypothetical protein